MGKKTFMIALTMGICICGGGQTLNFSQTDWGFAVVEARSQPKIEVMERELKKHKDYESSDVYRRSHELIYGDDKPARDGRVRIAVVINGDENMVVEDRVKNQVYSRLRQKFPIDYFAVIKGTDINSRLLQYAEDLYYDQREYATTRETEYNYSTATKGISASIGGGKRTYKPPTDQSKTVYIGSEVSGSVTGSQSNADSSDDDNGITSNDSFNNTVDSTTTGIINNITNTDNKGWGARIRIGGSKNNVSGDETRVTKSSRVDVDGMAIPNRPRGLADMRRMDYVRAGRECNYDYVFVLTLSNGKGKVYGHDYVLFNTNTVTKNVWLRVRLIDVNSGNYLYRNDIATSGKTHNGHINGRVLERSVANAMQEAMDDIKVSER